jgi:hypothetical protein
MITISPILILGSYLLFPVLNSGATQTARQLDSDIQGLYSKNAEFRAQARARLVQAGPEAVPLLLPLLCQASKSSSDSAWREAAKAIGDLKAEAGALCLVRLLASDLKPGDETWGRNLGKPGDRRDVFRHSVVPASCFPDYVFPISFPLNPLIIFLDEYGTHPVT